MATNRAPEPIELRPGQAISTLKKAARLDLIKKEVTLNDGTVVVFYHRPLVLAEREAANKAAGRDDLAFAAHLFITKAANSAGQLLFGPGQLAELKHEVRDSDMQKLMSAILDDGDEPRMDMKSTEAGSEEG